MIVEKRSKLNRLEPIMNIGTTQTPEFIDSREHVVGDLTTTEEFLHANHLQMNQSKSYPKLMNTSSIE